MFWQVSSPTRIIFGEGVLKEQSSQLQGMGKRALVVTGEGGSALRNGAQDAAITALKQAGFNKYAVFAGVEPNPSVETLRRGAQAAHDIKAELIVAVGGGSAMDAGKGIAVLAAEEVSEEALFAMDFNKALPIVAVPTTAGTGSEVTGVAIISSPLFNNKRGVSSPLLYPRLAFLDPAYTYDNPMELTVNTALDAYAHALESYLAFRSNPISDTYSLRALSILGACLQTLGEVSEVGEEEAELTKKDRENMMFGSLLSGLAISLTGVSTPHAISYPLTYERGVPHGRALSYIIPSWMAWNMRLSHNQRLLNSIRVSGFTNLAEMTELLNYLSGPVPQLSEEERERYLQLAMDAKSIFNGIVFPQQEDVRFLLEEIFG